MLASSASGKLSAFTLGYQPYSWSARELQWKTPPLADLVLYEINIAELAGDLDRARDLMAVSQRPRRNGIELMPLSNVGVSVDWGYLPIGYFGVDERFGKRSDFQQIVDIAHQHGLAVIVDVVYGHTGVDFPYYDAYTRLHYHDNPFMGPFAKDYFSNFGKSTDFQRQLTRDYFFTVNHHWLEVYHIDGFRYDCVPNYWDGPLGVGYASLVYETYQLTKAADRAGRSLIGTGSMPGQGRRSRSSSAPSSSRTRKGFCERRIRTAPGKIRRSTRPSRSRAAIGAGSPTWDSRSGFSATLKRRARTRT